MAVLRLPSRSTPLVLLAATALGVGFKPGQSAGLPLPEIASPKEVSAIVREIEVPPLFPTPPLPTPLDRRAFPAAALAGYEADVSIDVIRKPENAEMYAIRLAALDAIGVVRDIWGKYRLVIRTEFSGEPTDEVKKTIMEEQKEMSRAILKLEAAVNRLEKVREKREDETKRWQATFDYALALARSRLIFMQEYNLVLGQIRKENLPPLDPKKGRSVYRLTASDTIQSGGDTRRLADRTERLLDRIKKEHANTPWAAAAKLDRAIPPGLEWVAVKSK
jgi:uncharacterized coiled-coil protein SlyX